MRMDAFHPRLSQRRLAVLTATLALVVLAVLAGIGRCGSADSADWTVTVYYTPVEIHHTGPPTAIVGCLSLDCVHGSAALGAYRLDFVQAVRTEGAGRTADGRYLNWSHDVGFWLDHVPRDAKGQPLRPFESAAADADVLPAGTRFTITDCGRGTDGTAIDPAVCARLRQAEWTVTDLFAPGFGGPHHVDVYIGEETDPGFTESPWYCRLTGATLRVTAAPD